MEYSVTSNALGTIILFRGLKGKIIDYKLSSYLVNMKLIYLYYDHPNIEIHCSKVYNGTGKETEINPETGTQKVYLHEVKEPGIYHSKFVIITTTEMMRFIVMTTNITEQLIENCWNDYHIIDIPKYSKMYNTENVQILNRYLDAFNIKLKMPIIQYDWTQVKSRILVSIPNVVSHGICYQRVKQIQLDKFSKELGKPVGRMLGKAIIRSSSGMLGYDIRSVIGAQECTFEYVTNTEGMNWILYDLKNNEIKGKPKYQVKAIESEPFHFKRYTIDYSVQGKKSRWLIITSANLTRQAWGTTRYAAINAEMGIAWNTDREFPEPKSDPNHQIHFF